MSTIKTKEKEKNDIIVDKNMRDYSDDPFFKKKAEDAKAFLEKNGLFKSLSKKK